jgi:hypothetical protein
MKNLEVRHEEDGTFVYDKNRGMFCKMEAGYQQTRDEDAAYIVRACNSFPALVEALKVLINQEDWDREDVHIMSPWAKAKAALEKAGENV